MKLTKRALVLALSVLLCMGVLSGCGSTFTADGLLQGNLDLIYLDQYTDEYLQSVGLSETEAEQEYEAGIAVEVDYFCSYFDIDLSLCDDTIESQITELYHTIYSYSKYEVGEVTKNSDAYLVSLTVYPIDIIQKVIDEDAEDFYEDLTARSEAGEFEEMTDAEFEMVWAQAIIDLVSARTGSIGYLEAQTISVQITKDDDGYYAIDDSDFSRIDSLIIEY